MNKDAGLFDYFRRAAPAPAPRPAAPAPAPAPRQAAPAPAPAPAVPTGAEHITGGFGHTSSGVSTPAGTMHSGPLTYTNPKDKQRYNISDSSAYGGFYPMTAAAPAGFSTKSLPSIPQQYANSQDTGEHHYGTFIGRPPAAHSTHSNVAAEFGRTNMPAYHPNRVNAGVHEAPSFHAGPRPLTAAGLTPNHDNIVGNTGGVRFGITAKNASAKTAFATEWFKIANGHQYPFTNNTNGAQHIQSFNSPILNTSQLDRIRATAARNPRLHALLANSKPDGTWSPFGSMVDQSRNAIRQ